MFLSQTSMRCERPCLNTANIQSLFIPLKLNVRIVEWIFGLIVFPNTLGVVSTTSYWFPSFFENFFIQILRIHNRGNSIYRYRVLRIFSNASKGKTRKIRTAVAKGVRPFTHQDQMPPWKEDKILMNEALRSKGWRFMAR